MISRHWARILLVVFILCLLAGCNKPKNDTQARLNPPVAQQPAPHDVGQGSPEPTLFGRSETVVSTGPDLDRKAGVNLPDNHRLRRKWPREIASATVSPDGKTVALYDYDGVYLTDTHAKRLRKLHISPLLQNFASEHLVVWFQFRPDSRRVAILTTLVFGEPQGAYIERLWTADVATGRVRRLAAWGDRVQGQGPQTGERSLKRWSLDGKSVILTGVIYDGVDMPSDAKRVGTERIVVKDKPKHSR